MDKQKIIAQIAVLRQSAKQLENQVQKIISYCDYVEIRVTQGEAWGNIALPVAAEDIGVLALTCVKRAIKLDTLITLVCETEDREPNNAGFGSFGSAPQSL